MSIMTLYLKAYSMSLILVLTPKPVNINQCDRSVYRGLFFEHVYETMTYACVQHIVFSTRELLERERSMVCEVNVNSITFLTGYI